MIKYFLCTLFIFAVLTDAACPEEKTENLVAHWTFEKLTDNKEKTPDSSGNGRHGRIHGQVLVKGIVGSAMKFKGYDQIVEVGDLGLEAPATVAFWVRTNDVFPKRRGPIKTTLMRFSRNWDTRRDKFSRGR